MRFARVSALLGLIVAAAGLAGACANDEHTNPLAVDPGTAVDLQMFTPELPRDLSAQLEGALARDAYRREARFLDAVNPGRSLRATDANEQAIERGVFDHATLYDLGAQLFHLSVTREQGFGSKDFSSVSRVHTGERGAPDARKCSACHWRGGQAGGGDGADAAYFGGDGDAQSSALGRNPIALQGDGFIEILAREMTAELRAARDSLVADAARAKAPVRRELTAKGIAFGALTASPTGAIDTSEVVGVDPDLAVRPFGWKGRFESIRDAVEDGLRVHLGLESDALVRAGDPTLVGPFGGEDPDGDGVRHEIREGQVTVLTLFVAMQEVPVSVAPDDPVFTQMYADGQARFGSLGCGGCHTPSMPLKSSLFTLSSREGGAPIAIDLSTDGAEPRISKSELDGELRAFLFSDLKRHEMGASLADARADHGVAPSVFLTRPLWGVARSGPYLHDGRAATLEDAILAHGGEAEGPRDAYAALPDADRATVRVFLTSLTRAKRLATQ